MERREWRGGKNIPFRCKCSSFSSPSSSLLLVPVLHGALGCGRGIKSRTDEFRQAASRPELAAGWGCLFFQHRTPTLTFIYRRNLAAPRWQADGRPITDELPDNKKSHQNTTKKRKRVKFCGGVSHSRLKRLMGRDRGECRRASSCSKKLMQMEILRRKFGKLGETWQHVGFHSFWAACWSFVSTERAGPPPESAMFLQ